MVSLRAVAMTILALGGCGASLRRPYLGLLMLVTLYFFRPDLWGAERFVRPVLWLTIAVTVGWLLQRRRGRSSPALRWLVALLAVYTVSTSLAPLANLESWSILKEIAKIFVVVFLITELCDTPRRLAGLLAAMLVGHLWFVKVTLLSWAAVGFSDTMQINTMVGQGGGSNYIAWVLATTTPSLVYKLLRGHGWQRTLAAGLLPMWLAAILATGSRGGLLCLAAGLFVLLILMRQIRAAVTAAVICLLFVTLMPAGRWQRAETITLNKEKMDRSTLARYQNIQIGLNIIADHPLLGTGLDTFPTAKTKYLPRDYVGGPRQVAHNTLIQMGSEVGLVFLATFLALNLYVVRRLRFQVGDILEPEEAAEMEWVRVGMLAALGATAVQMLKGDMAKVDYFWWFYGIAMAYDRVRMSAVQRNRKPAGQAPSPRSSSLPLWLQKKLAS